MKSVSLFLAGLLLCSGLSYATEPIGNDPKGALEDFKKVIDRLEPRGGLFWNLEANELIATTGVKVLSYDLKEIPIELVAAYGVNKTVIGSLETDVLKILKKLSINVNIPVVTVHAGFGAGYSGDSRDLVYGPTAEVSFKF